MASSLEQPELDKTDLASLMDVQIAAGTYVVDFYAQWMIEQEDWGACCRYAEQPCTQDTKATIANGRKRNSSTAWIEPFYWCFSFFCLFLWFFSFFI